MVKIIRPAVKKHKGNLNISVTEDHVVTAGVKPDHIQEERELSKEFMAVVRTQFPLIRDPIIVEYVNQVGKRILAAVPPQPFGRKQVTGDLLVVRRRRCLGIDSSSLLDLVSENPSVNVNVFMGQDTGLSGRKLTCLIGRSIA